MADAGEREAAVLDTMRGIIDPDSGKDIVSLGFVEGLHIDGGVVSFRIVTSRSSPSVVERFCVASKEAVGSLPWVEEVHVEQSSHQQSSALDASGAGLDGIKRIVAVFSCKGGVGKSTVAVNLAYQLAAEGRRVGLFDADVYGPSLPTLVRPADDQLYAYEDQTLVPLEHHGVHLMSFGFVPQSQQGAAIMRGPIVTNLINQLLTGTNWGELDYLIIDFPPGTGDIPLTLTQLLPLSGAVLVTTPQQLSFVDVVKGIQMFDKLKVPTVAVAENMSYFRCPDCGKAHYLFGRGSRHRLAEQFGIKHAFEFPLVAEIAQTGDAGKPYVMAYPESEVTRTFQALSDSMGREISVLEEQGHVQPTYSYDPLRGLVIQLPDSGQEAAVSARDVRLQCRCALCVDELSGKARLDPNEVPEDVYPSSIQPMGNYAVSISWSDGHQSSIYPHERLLSMAGLEQEAKQASQVQGAVSSEEGAT